MEKEKEHQIRVSSSAFEELKERSKSDKFKTRGVTGVVDHILFGKFTTSGKGRVLGSKNKQKAEKDLDN